MAKKSDLIRKLKENATKYVHKSEYDKALDQYRQLAKLEPSDLRFRMKVGECLSKLNKKQDAIKEYNEVAKLYTDQGFLIQAIALSKLILQLDPSETSAANRIAELNSRRGIADSKKAPVRPALSLAGMTAAIPSPAGAPTAEEPENAPSLEDQEVIEPMEELEPEPEASAEEEEEEAAPELLQPSEEPPMPPGTPDQPIPLEEAPENLEEEPAAEETKPVFPETPLFSDLNVEEFKKVVAKFQIGTLPKGITVIKEGSRGDSFFIIAGGKVRVYKMSANQKRKMTLAVLEEGSFFGEFAFLTNSIRSASVETLEECVLLRINRKDLEEIIKEFPHVQNVMNDFYKKRVLDTLLMISPLFESLSDADRREVIKKFESVELDTGDVIIREGEEGKALYLIKHGSINVSIKHPQTGLPLKVASLKEGDFFGEISLLQNKPTTANCAATEPTSLFRLPKAAFNELIMIHPQILDTVSATVEERLKSTTKHLTATAEERQNSGLV